MKKSDKCMKCGLSFVSKRSMINAVKLIGSLEHSHQNQDSHGFAIDLQFLEI